MPSYRVRASRWSCPAWWKERMLRWHPSCPADVLQSSSSGGGQKPSTAPPTSWSSRLQGRRASGFSEEELLAGKCQTLDEILPEVLAEVKPFEAQFGHDIPVFVAGGVYTGEDIAHYTRMGAAGAQLATRFIPTYECDASQTYKDVLLAAKPEDVRIIHSPVGMPGRALATPLVQKLEQGLRFPPKHCARCLKACEPAKVPYCITHALIEAVKGNVEEGLFFCGANVGRLDRMRSVRELMDELMDDWRKHQ